MEAFARSSPGRSPNRGARKRGIAVGVLRSTSRCRVPSVGRPPHQSDATTLVAADTNAKTDVFVQVLATGVTSRVSVSGGRAQQTKASEEPTLSTDGSIIAFDLLGSSLASGDTNSRRDIFIKDLATGAVTRLSVDTAEVQGNDTSRNASLSGDGTTVAFESDSTNLVSNDTNGSQDVFMRGPSLAQ